MTEPYVGEIRMFAGNFAPRGWAFCDGQLLAVSSNDALFSLLGTIYGGDGRTTFGLPDLRGRLAIHQGTGPGLSPRNLGSKGGQEQVTLNANQLGGHGHTWKATTAGGSERTPLNHALAEASPNLYSSNNPPSTPVTMDGGMVQNSAGGGQGHENRQPFQCINYIIALFGIYPSRT